MSTNKTESFDCLVLGLREFIEQKNKYPYPDLLRYGMNTLSLEMNKGINFPKTIGGFLQLVEEPIKDWCPNDFIPKEFDSDFGLMDEGSLSEEANDYLTEVLLEGGIPEYASAVAKQLAMDNLQFTKIIDKLRDIYSNVDTERSQQEYLLLRPFLIKNEFTTTSKIRKVFRRTKYISIEEIGELYEECPENQTYWICDLCGILTEKSGRLRGLKPNLCGNHHQDLSYVHQVTWKVDLLRIKDGIHQRVSFPGIPELNLCSALEELQAEHPEYLKEVHLYPGVDRYDLQLRFADGAVWAIDFKDVQYPYRLAKKLVALYNEGNLRYDESFYVISDRCVNNQSNYLKIARKEAKKLPKTTHILSDKVFRSKVIEKIIELQTGEIT